MRKLALDPVGLVTLIIQGTADQMAETVHRMFSAVTDAFDHTGDRPVTNRLARIVATDEHVLEAATDPFNLAQHGHGLSR